MTVGGRTPDDGFEILGDPEHDGPFVFTCEHASNALPGWLAASAGDRALLDDHWGWDIGARDTAAALVDALGGHAVAATFSRLVADPNRMPTEPTYIRRTCGDQPVSFNQTLPPAEVRRRTTALFDRYHAALDDTVAARIARGAVRLVSIHSFTPVYFGERRSVEVGVLFDDYESEAEAVRAALEVEGFCAALNEPYSGRPPHGLVYAVQRHGRAHQVPYLELEIRQDLIATRQLAREVAPRVARALAAFAG